MSLLEGDRRSILFNEILFYKSTHVDEADYGYNDRTEKNGW